MRRDKLISGPGSTLTETKCKICHELQHIRRTPLSRGEWADNLKNMKERGTPMTDSEQAVILDYLSTYYNREKPAPAPSADTLASASDDPMEELLGARLQRAGHGGQGVVGSVPRGGGEVPRRCARARASRPRSGRGGQGKWGNADAAESGAIGKRPASPLGLGAAAEVGKKKLGGARNRHDEVLAHHVLAGDHLLGFAALFVEYHGGELLQRVARFVQGAACEFTPGSSSMKPM